MSESLPAAAYPATYELAMHVRRLAAHTGWPWLHELAKRSMLELEGGQIEAVPTAFVATPLEEPGTFKVGAACPLPTTPGPPRPGPGQEECEE